MISKKNTEKINIQGGELHITKIPGRAYRVLKGSLLVYLLPVKDVSLGRRMFILEVPEGEVIPAFAYDDSILGSWRFGFVALDRAEFEETIPDNIEEIRLSFAKKIKLGIDEPSDFEEALIEQYNLNTVKEEAYIYSARQEIEKTRERSLSMILDMFKRRGSDWESTGTSDHTGNLLYDAAAFICRRNDINIAPVEKIRQSAGRSYKISDIARVSHFTIRDIVLEEGWYRKDGGSFLAFGRENRHPYALIPSGISRYKAYDPDTGEFIRVDRDFAEAIEPAAIMLYRPFPEEKINVGRLIAFGMRSVYPSDIVRVVILALTGSLIGLLIPVLNEQIYDRFIPSGNSEGLKQVGCVILACALGNVCFTIVKNMSSFRAMKSMEYAVQSAAIDRLFGLPESFFRGFEAADLGMRVMNISQIYSLVAQSAINSSLSAFFSLIYLFRMFRYSKTLTGWGLAMLAISVLAVILIGFQQMFYEGEKLKVDNEASSAMFQFISGIAKLRMSSSENRALIKYLEKYTISRGINLRKESMTVWVSTFIEAVQVFFSVVFYYIMIKKNLDISMGAFIGFTSAFGSLSAAIFTISQNFLVVNQIKPLYEMARPILETLPESNDESIVPEELTGEIEIDNVTFSYDEGGEPVLNDLNLHFLPGEYVGIVGSSGCGKSTLLKLLMGFETPQIGRIYYDGQDIDDLDKRELRKKFGVVLQDGGLIAGSIYDNITITAPGCKADRVREVIREVGLEKDIEEMPMGLYTPITAGTATISGGQAQRILIARAIVGKPKIIFFDEATSALDNVTQKQVTDTLEKLDATRVVIAHRISTIVNCDRIIVMDEGEVVEQGSYEELMAKKGKFYEFAIRQIA